MKGHRKPLPAPFALGDIVEQIASGHKAIVCNVFEGSQGSYQRFRGYDGEGMVDTSIDGFVGTLWLREKIEGKSRRSMIVQETKKHYRRVVGAVEIPASVQVVYDEIQAMRMRMTHEKGKCGVCQRAVVPAEAERKAS